MRSIFLILLLANVVLFAAQFAAVREFVTGTQTLSAPTQLNAERLRIIRDTSNRPVVPVPPAANPAAN